MSDVTKIPCSRCGVMILPATSGRTGGLCRPCYGGYRKDIEFAKEQRQEEDDFRQTPFWQYWLSLNSRVHSSPGGFDALSDNEKIFYAMRILLGSVFRSGFFGYFEDMADHHSYALTGLRSLGATETLDLVNEAARILLGKDDVPPQVENRVLPDIGSFEAAMPERARRLMELEQRFWKDPDDLYARTIAYGVAAGLFEDA